MIADALKADEEAWAGAEEVATGGSGTGAAQSDGLAAVEEAGRARERLRRKAAEASRVARDFLRMCDERGIRSQKELTAAEEAASGDGGASGGAGVGSVSDAWQSVTSDPRFLAVGSAERRRLVLGVLL